MCVCVHSSPNLQLFITVQLQGSRSKSVSPGRHDALLQGAPQRTFSCLLQPLGHLLSMAVTSSSIFKATSVAPRSLSPTLIFCPKESLPPRWACWIILLFHSQLIRNFHSALPLATNSTSTQVWGQGARCLWGAELGPATAISAHVATRHTARF